MALTPISDHLPPALLEACVVLGASHDRLKELYQVKRNNTSGDISVPKDIDLKALPHLCFPDGLQVTNELKEERFHFLVFTDVFGNRTHGVVMQYYRLIMNGHGSFHSTRLYSAYGFCVISKYPYYSALKDCMSCLLVQLRTSRLSDMEERVKEFTARLALVPVPPPGPLHVMFSLPPLNIVLPAREDEDCPPVDLDLQISLLCFRPQQLLQVLSSLLQEQRVVLFSADWAQLTLVAESLLLFLKPMSWQHPYVPVLASGMLDFLMAPTAFLMGCHSSHYKDVAAETDDLILIHIDAGTVSRSQCDTVGLPEIPIAAADCFTQRCMSLQLHFQLFQCQRSSCSDINEQRAQKRAWQRSLNMDIQKIMLELMVNIFRDVSSHLNFEHRVFNSEEFLKTREPPEMLFYKMVLETHVFHFFLKDRLNRKMDSFARMELHTRSEMQKLKCMVVNPRRPTMQEIQARRTGCHPEAMLNKRLGMSLPNLGDHPQVTRQTLTKILIYDPSKTQTHTHSLILTLLQSPLKCMRVFKLPELPASLSLLSIQRFYNELILQLGKAIFCVPPENSALLARYTTYLQLVLVFVYLVYLFALRDFQNLYKTDTSLFPTQLVAWLVDSLLLEERQLAERRPELKRLFLKRVSIQPDDHVKKFELPRCCLAREAFVRCVQESGIVKDGPTIQRLFDALTDHVDEKQVDPTLFKDVYTFWKEAEAQDVDLPPEVVDRLDNNECVYKLSSCVKTSHGVGKIAMTQKRLFLLQEGRPGLWEITRFRDITEVKISSSPFLLLRVPSLCIRTACRAEGFEANLKTETGLWDLVIREMWAGRRMADQHKDPQYMAQALTNMLLMDAVAGCLHSQRSIGSASKLAYFDRIKHEVPMMVPEATSQTLKHKINPSQDLAEPQTVHVLLYTPGQLSCSDTEEGGNPKLWVALSGGRVVVFDAASWSMLQDCIQVGNAQLNCMLGVGQDQVWIGSQDSVIYIVDPRSMSCNKQLTEHRHEVTALLPRPAVFSEQPYSCSAEGIILLWDASSLTVNRQLLLTCDRLSSIQIHNGMLWCCTYRSRVCVCYVLNTSWVRLSVCVCSQLGQLWTGCPDSGELCVWHTSDAKRPVKRIPLPGISGVNCMIRVKDQVGGCDQDLRSLVLVVDPGSHAVQKELQAHSDTIHTLCSAEHRYVLSGSGRRDGKIAIWKVD
uniref:UDENN domain-containing protein n=1 Tax=Gadus morhua TaxID=8049 RepID=A0A8C5B566_GADMO